MFVFFLRLFCSHITSARRAALGRVVAMTRVDPSVVRRRCVHARVSSDEPAAKRSLGGLFPRRTARRASVSPSRFVPVVPLGTSLTPSQPPPRVQGPRAPAIERRRDRRVRSPRVPDDRAPRLRRPDARPATRGPRWCGARERHVPSDILGKRERDWRLWRDRQLRPARDSRAALAEASVGTQRSVQAGQAEARDFVLHARRVALSAQA